MYTCVSPPNPEQTLSIPTVNRMGNVDLVLRGGRSVTGSRRQDWDLVNVVIGNCRSKGGIEGEFLGLIYTTCYAKLTLHASLAPLEPRIRLCSQPQTGYMEGVVRPQRNRFVCEFNTDQLFRRGKIKLIYCY